MNRSNPEHSVRLAEKFNDPISLSLFVCVCVCVCVCVFVWTNNCKLSQHHLWIATYISYLFIVLFKVFSKFLLFLSVYYY